MKTRIVLSMMGMLLSFGAWAQTDSTNASDGWEQKSIFKSGNGKTTHGFYGGIITRYGQVSGNGSALLGAKGAWIINHKLGIGISGNSIMNRTKTSANGNVFAGYAGGNGGIMIEPIIFADKAVHITLPVVFGGGFIGSYTYFGNDLWDTGKYVAFGLIEPGIEVELNVIKWFRVSFGAYYAFRSEVDSYKMDTDIMSPLSLGATFKFGKF